MRALGASILAAHDALIRLLAMMAAAAIGGLVVLICADVALRNLARTNIAWTTEVTEDALLGIALLAAPWVLSLGAHVRMDLLSRALPTRAARALDVAASLLGAAITGLLAWQGLLATLASQARGSLVLKTLVFPEWLLVAVMPLSMALLALGFVRRAAEVAAGEPARSDEPVAAG